MISVPLFGAGVGTKSVNVSAQSRLNLYVEHLTEPDKTGMAIYARPGLSSYVSSSTPLSGAAVTSGIPKVGVLNKNPVRGMIVNYVVGSTVASSIVGVLGNVLFQYINNTLFLQYPNYLTSTLFTTSTGRVSIVNDGINIAIADGVAGYYAPQYTPAQMLPIADVDFPQTTPSMTVIASRVVCCDPAAVGRFRWSAPGDVTSWDPLDFATAESCPDTLTAVFEANGELLLFGPESLEFWAPSGDTDIFRRIGSTGAQWGTDAVGTIQKVGNRVMFLGRSQTGTQSVVILEGYHPRVVSTPDIDADIEAIASTTNATASVITWQGHTFYVIHLGTKSWAYDLRDNSWSLWGTSGSRYIGEYHVQFQRYSVVSDYLTSNLYTLADVYTDNSASLAREVTSRHQFQNLDRVRCLELVVDVEYGVGLTSGQGVDPQIMLQVSKDGGHTWGNELWTSLGALGNYGGRAIWRRLGIARDWLFRLRVTDPVKVVIIGGYATFE